MSFEKSGFTENKNMLLFLLIIFKIWLSFDSIRSIKKHKLLRVGLDCERQKHYPSHVKIFTVFWEACNKALYSQSITLSCSSPCCLLVNGISHTFIYILVSGNMKFYIYSEGTPKLCQKLLNLGHQHPQDVRKKGSKILKLPRFAIVLY